MAFKFKDAGSVIQTAAAMKAKDGSTLRNILRMKVMDADGSTLRTVATFVPALTASVSLTDSGVVQTTAFVVLTATPSGGLGPYNYSWALISGSGWSIGSPTSATSSMSGEQGVATTPTFRVTITDSSGQTATADYSG